MPRPAAPNACTKRRHVAGRADADGVADAQLAGPEVEEPPADRDDLLDRHRALPRVAEAHRDVRPHVDARVPRPADGRLEHRELAVEGVVEVLGREGLGGAAEDRDVPAAELQGPVEAAFVGHEHREVAAAVAEERHQLGRVGQLRDPLRVHERRRLDDRQPGVEQPGDELRLDLGRDQRGLVLEAVAGADLVDRDALGQPVEGDDGGALHQALLLDHEEPVPQRHLVADRRGDVGDRAREGCLEGQLHLHRLHHAEHVALGDGVARGHPHVEHGAGHRRDHRPVAGGRAVVGEDVRLLEDEPLAPVGDLRGVRLHVDDGDLASAVDAEHRDVVLGRQLPDLVLADRPGGRSTSSVSSSSTTVGDGVPPSRQPSDWNGCPVSWTATSRAWIHAAKTRGTSGLGGSTTAVSSQAVSMVASRNSSLATSARRNPVLVVSPRMPVASSASTSARRAVSRSGPWAITLPSIGSYDVLTTWPLASAWSTRTPVGPAHQVGRAGLREEPAERVLGVDPGLDGVAGDGDVVLAERQRLAGRDVELGLHQVDAGDRLGDRVLDLEAGVHLQEVGLVGLGVEQELHRAGVGVADLAGQRDRAVGDQAADGVADRRRRRLLEDLLVPALGRAVPLVEVHDVAVAVGEDLHLDVAAVLDVLLDEHGVVAERRQRLALGGGDRLVEVLGPADDAHALAAATGRCLHEHGERRAVALGHDGDARPDGDLAGGVLATHLVHHGGRGSHEADLGLLERLGEGGALGEEAVPRVHGVGVDRLRGGDDRPDVEVAADVDRVVGRRDVRGLAVDVGVDRHAAPAGLAARTDHAQRDLAAVGDEHGPDGASYGGRHAITSGRRRRRAAGSGRSRRRRGPCRARGGCRRAR